MHFSKFLFVFMFWLTLNLQAADRTSVEDVINDLTITSEITPGIIIKLLRLQEILNEDDLSKEIELVKTIKNGQYSNGQKSKNFFGGTFYPNGKAIKDARGRFHYFNGNEIKDALGKPHYPNGKEARDSRNRFYNPSGNQIKTAYNIDWPPKESMEIRSLPKQPAISKDQPITFVTDADFQEEILDNRLIDNIIAHIVNMALEIANGKKFIEAEIERGIQSQFVSFAVDQGLSMMSAEQYFNKAWSNHPKILEMKQNLLRLIGTRGQPIVTDADVREEILDRKLTTEIVKLIGYMAIECVKDRKKFAEAEAKDEIQSQFVPFALKQGLSRMSAEQYFNKAWSSNHQDIREMKLRLL